MKTVERGVVFLFIVLVSVVISYFVRADPGIVLAGAALWQALGAREVSNGR